MSCVFMGLFFNGFIASGVDMIVHGVLCDLGRISHTLRACISYVTDHWVTDHFANGWDSEDVAVFMADRASRRGHVAVSIVLG